VNKSLYPRPVDRLLLRELRLLCELRLPLWARDRRPPSSPERRLLSLVALIVPSSPAMQNLLLISKEHKSIMRTRDEPELMGRTSSGARMLTDSLTRAPRVVPKAGGRKPTPREGAALTRPGARLPRDAPMVACRRWNWLKKSMMVE